MAGDELEFVQCKRASDFGRAAKTMPQQAVSVPACRACEHGVGQGRVVPE